MVYCYNQLSLGYELPSSLAKFDNSTVNFSNAVFNNLDKVLVHLIINRNVDVRSTLKSRKCVINIHNSKK